MAQGPTLTFSHLWDGHPAVCGELNPCSSDDGEPHFDNQCAIRMGLALAAAGAPLHEYGGARCWHGHPHVHVLRAQELADWLRGREDLLGEAEVHKRTGAGPFAGRRGVVFFRDFWGTGNRGDHIDVWDGSRMGSGEEDYFERAKEVWFWPLS